MVKSTVMKKGMAVVLSVALVAGLPMSLNLAPESGAASLTVNRAFGDTQAAPTLNAKSKTLAKGKSFTLKVKNAGSHKVTWTSSNKKVATVSKKGKVTAKKAGTTKITAKVGSKKLTCKVTVKSTAKKLGKPKITSFSYTAKPNSNYTRTGKIRWSKVSGAAGYQVAVMWGGHATVWVHGEKTKENIWDGTWSILGTTKQTSFSHTNVGGKYGTFGMKVKVRAYKNANGKKVYGPWSAAKGKWLG